MKAQITNLFSAFPPLGHKAEPPRPASWLLITSLLSGMLLGGAGRAFGQVSPAEVPNPRLRAVEQTYFQELVVLHRAIESTQFPSPFVLSRYAGLDPESQIQTDTRGLEFVIFHDRLVLKITGNYNVAYNAERLTQNQRASRTYAEVILPILRLLPREIPANVTCDAIGFEISYHVRTRARNYDYEGKEILVVVLDKADAFAHFNSARDSEQQELLNRSEIYLNGKEFGLALDVREPFPVESLDRSALRAPAKTVNPASGEHTAGTEIRLAQLNQDVPLGIHLSGAGAAAAKPTAPAASLPQTVGTALPGSPDPAPHPISPEAQGAPAGAATQADADRLQAKYQVQLDALSKLGVEKFHFVNYSPPSFVVFRNKLFLQLTLHNPLPFDKASSSIYKRAAQSFDLFLAPQLKALVGNIPVSSEIEGVDITLLNQLASMPTASSEAVEFVCPLKPLRQFVDAEITNQDLIGQSVVLVNGVRIALNLQQVE